MSPMRSNTLTVSVFQIHVELSILMTIANDLSALSEHILLIAFVVNPVLISWLELQLRFSLACLLHSNGFEFKLLYNALSTLLFTLLYLATVGLRHSGHVIPILAYRLCKIKAMTRN